MNHTPQIVKILVLAILLIVVAYLIPIFRSGPVNTGAIENIHGIPYFVYENGIQITEELAHGDVHLREPALLKKLRLSVTFDPQELEHIDVGVRENSFWLSYPKVRLYERGVDKAGAQTRQIEIPLTDKFQEPNQSLDIMFFASSKEPTWTLINVTAETKLTTATLPQVKNYIASIIKRERAQ